ERWPVSRFLVSCAGDTFRRARRGAEPYTRDRCEMLGNLRPSPPSVRKSRSSASQRLILGCRNKRVLWAYWENNTSSLCAKCVRNIFGMPCAKTTGVETTAALEALGKSYLCGGRRARQRPRKRCRASRTGIAAQLPPARLHHPEA